MEYKFTDFIVGIKNVFTSKRMKVTLYIAIVLWLAVITQIMVNRVFREDIKITQAFVKTNTSGMQGSLEIIAEHDKGFLSEEEKKDLIRYIAEDIGVNIDSEITVDRENTKTEYTFFKQAKNASTMIKVVSMDKQFEKGVKTTNYVIIKINLLQSIWSVDKYKDIVEKSLMDIGMDNLQVTLQYEGNHPGKMSVEEMENMANLMVKELQGKTAWDYNDNNMFVVYAYTGLLNEYIMSMGSKVNIHIAFTYDEQSDRTCIYLATPIINESF